ncbi:transglycosylase domain-containing protein [Methylocaldum sp. RMAD-M]|jgi:membrane peptidoglycan carboxypeptidase|uniref:transglycosylase domain-containing protein n=1 Tax=Methylocaldum sp. RMAD-M TaxID=2806557 RepID=UPI000A323517|nr:transglycosylase domain-containing protein [Methylocaldum sp. RMAD-M]MBP1152351.1 membrane peptidoglycan carboxypeptidase [Methylocaldum sp. RMAD-M]
MSQRSGALFRITVWSTAGALLALTAIYIFQEIKTSDFQSRYFSSIDEHLRFQVEPGGSAAIRYPSAGPYDERLGYTALPSFQQRLRNLGFSITAQARFSPELLRVVDKGFYATYFEKIQAGLTIFDRDSEVLFSKTYPTRIYPDFDAIPPLVIKTLLFIENRELLDDRYPHLNPAIEWDRFARATMELIARKLGADINVAGGSTLATQMEKYRHSPGGRTDNPMEKLRQMSSASLRAYLLGPDTRKARRGIVQAYLNSMPLAAVPDSGEVHGLGDGLQAWFGSDFAAVNQLLGAANLSTGEGITAEQALAYRQVLCLLLAQRRPAYYLLAGRADLENLADSHLRVLAAQGVIPTALRDAALSVSGATSVQANLTPAAPLIDRKTESVLRARLATALGVSRIYDLDRLDLTARSTIDYDIQQAVAQALRRLREPEQARAAGVLGFRLLSTDSDFGEIVYSFVLYERSSQGNLLRVQADNNEQPLDVNEGIRLDLGSTAKLRTLVHYLEIIAELYDQYAGQPSETLRRAEIHPRDHLSRWVVDQLLANRKIGLSAMLEAALERRYSASPGEAFFTGGGLHTFANFNKDDNSKIMSLRVALQESVNLVFIRLMRDVVYYHLYKPDGVARWMDAKDSEKRQQYLERFADQEGKAYLRRFYAKYRNKTPQEALDILTGSVHPVPKRLATVYRSVYPRRDVAALRDYLQAHHVGQGLSAEDITDLYEKYSTERFDLQDRGYIARIHPLELWLVSYLVEHPNATLGEVVGASAQERQQVYRWLFKTSRRYAQDKRIRTLLENEAFAQIHRAWKRLGYPFGALTPSYASSIGASGDRPAALAELMGILLNDGVRLPMVRFDAFHFAADTPYETLMQLTQAQGRRVLSPEVAAAARSALIDVVERGTAIRVKGVYKGPTGTPLVMAGKTGTGDHQREIFGPGGRLIATQVISRTATFAFMLGDRHFGTVTAYVTGPAAARYRFTSALPVQVLKSLEPTLTPLIARAYSEPPESRPHTVTAATAKGFEPAPMTQR